MMLKTVAARKTTGNIHEENKENCLTIDELVRQVRGKNAYTDENLMELADLIEKNPRFLDFLLKFYLISQDIDKEELFKSLEKTQDKYIVKALERLIFIKQCPWSEQYKIFRNFL